MENITKEKYIDYVTDEDGRRILRLKNYEKRVDHRHHAIDALTVACTTHEHIQYINTLEAQSKDEKLKWQYQKLLKSNRVRDFRLPWKSFVPDTMKVLDEIIISVKNHHRILSKSINNYFAYEKVNGEWKKALKKQAKGRLLAVRKPLHKETIAGTVTFREYKKYHLTMH